ncbi:MAG: hypothetical protein A3K76_00625 [Euryarchaeota archaeon RBG_13_57_23]|nr:MAG: hypothetical protein A3K76_00625 [Euryarchaeota archaeon RBG_13_57_23]
MAKCPNCGSDNPDYSFYCGRCSAELKDSSGKPYVEPKPATPPPPRKVVPKLVAVKIATQTVNPVIGGVCVSLAGLLAFVQGAIALVGEVQILEFTGSRTGWLMFWGFFFIVVGMGAILLGSRAMRRVGYPGALIGAVLGIVGIGFGIGPFLAVAGLVLIALSREEFEL